MEQIFLDDTTRCDRRDWKWTKLNEARAKDVREIVYKYRDFWPLTSRFVYYRLLSNAMIKQNHWRKNSNPEKETITDFKGALGVLLKWMRIDGKIPWYAIDDDTRILTGKRGFDSAEDFVRFDMENFLRGYSRCVAQDQPYHIEVWLEKRALLPIVEPVADEFCRRVLCCRGYNSVAFQAQFYQRTMDALNLGLKPLVLYFGDWDPSGVNMLYAAIQTIHDELGLSLDSVEYWRCGINPDHFPTLRERPEKVAIKNKDPRRKKFIEQHGRTAYELDAFEPDELQDLVRGCITEFTDMEALSCNVQIEDRERPFLQALKGGVEHYITRHMEKFNQG